MFVESSPTLETQWRAIILFGRNSASYKFALAKTLIHLASLGGTSIPLDELASPFATAVVDRLRQNDRQGTATASRFLTACRQYRDGQISQDTLVARTVQYGFVNVIDAFHTVSQAELPARFFLDDRQDRRAITLTDDLFTLRETPQFLSLPSELESRWRLIETAWAVRLNPGLLEIQHDEVQGILFAKSGYLRRTNVTSSRDALNGYQKGRCFYCFADISLDRASPNAADIDHFFPFALTQLPPAAAHMLNGVWNLVLSCHTCNRGPQGKFDRVPHIQYLQRLHSRNNYLIDSHHPLRETVMAQTGSSEMARRTFLQGIDATAIGHLIARWKPTHELPAVF